jgi:hypothetical protein
MTSLLLMSYKRTQSTEPPTFSPGIAITSGPTSNSCATNVDTRAIYLTTTGHGGTKTPQSHRSLTAARPASGMAEPTLLTGATSVYPKGCQGVLSSLSLEVAVDVFLALWQTGLSRLDPLIPE